MPYGRVMMQRGEENRETKRAQRVQKKAQKAARAKQEAAIWEQHSSEKRYQEQRNEEIQPILGGREITPGVARKWGERSSGQLRREMAREGLKKKGGGDGTWRDWLGL